MSKAYSIRQPRMEGDPIAEISRKPEVSRDTVYKYLAMDDPSQKPPAPRGRVSVLDRYRPLIESRLDEDERNWRKQCQRPGAWVNGKVRSALPDDLREHMDSLDKPDLKSELRLMRDQAATSGWDATVRAMAGALLATGRIDRASVAVGAARIAGGAVEYDEPVDLSAYDSAFSPVRG